VLRAARAVETGVSGGDGGGGRKRNVSRGKWEGEGGKRKGVGRFLNPFMFTPTNVSGPRHVCSVGDVANRRT
jgi:hypothetical protein